MDDSPLEGDFAIDTDGRIAASRPWVHPEGLREVLDRLDWRRRFAGRRSLPRGVLLP